MKENFHLDLELELLNDKIVHIHNQEDLKVLIYS